MPHTFYTYQFVYLPDLTQKYGLKVYAGPGELRTTMNLVNGWMHTGTGPMYMRDSTTAASIAAVGLAAGNILDSAKGLSMPGASQGSEGLASLIKELLKNKNISESLTSADDKNRVWLTQPALDDYAELYVFEPVVIVEKRQKRLEWNCIFHKVMNREYIKLETN